MKIHKNIKIAAGSLLGIFSILFVVLVVHIATAKPLVYDNPSFQISRIDFNETIDSSMAKKITTDMKSIPGVKNPLVVAKNKVVVYYHDMNIANSEKVYDQFMKKGNYNAKRYIVSAEIASKEVCPVMDKNSFKYKFSRGIQRIFN